MKKSMDIVLAGGLILCIVLAVLGYFLLPDTLVMQITASGAAGTTMPKLLGNSDLACLFLLCPVLV